MDNLKEYNEFLILNNYFPKDKKLIEVDEICKESCQGCHFHDDDECLRNNIFEKKKYKNYDELNDMMDNISKICTKNSSIFKLK